MSHKYAQRSIKELEKLGITEYAIIALKSGEALVFDRRVLQYRQGPRTKLAMAHKRFDTYEEAIKAIHLAHYRETAVFAVRMPLRGLGGEWSLSPGTRSEAVFLEGETWWVRFPGGVDFIYDEVATNPDMFERLHSATAVTGHVR